MITHGQARRIAAGWHAPRNAFSWLSHKGTITSTLEDEIVHELKGVSDPQARVDLMALRRYVSTRGVGEWQGQPWHKTWDDTPVEPSQA